MFELIVRVVLASSAMAASGALGKPNFELAWRVSLFFAAYSYLLYVMEQRDARNPGISGLAAVADCGIIAVLLADLGLLQQFGFVSAIPMVLAFTFKKSNAAMMSPLVASWLMVGSNLMGGGDAFTTEVLLQALGILICGLALQQGKTILDGRREKRHLNAITAPIQDAMLQELIAKVASNTNDAVAPVNDDMDEFRESFRTLSDSARDLEKKSRRDRACVQMVERTLSQKAKPFQAITTAMQDYCGSEGVILYSISQYGDALVGRAFIGSVDHTLEEAALELSHKEFDANLLERADSLIYSLREPDSKRKFANLLLKVHGKVVGLISLFHNSSIELEASVRRANETLDFTSELVADSVFQEQTTRRLRESELLYSIATMTTGAAEPEDIINRVTRELWDTVELDHLSFCLIEDGQSKQISREGTDIEIIDEVSFTKGYGLSGWIDSGAPFASILDARNDSRIATHSATKKRIGSLLIVPIEFGSTPIGYVIATTSKTAGIDLATTETIRVVCAETSHALARATDLRKGSEGLATPKEFYAAVRAAGKGFFVYLEVPKKDALADVYGKPAIDHAVRKFAVRLRSELPAGSIACRRPEGDYVAFIPGSDEEFARSWSNDVITLASMVGVHTPDGRTRIPLALRSKLAPVNQQLSGISEGTAA